LYGANDARASIANDRAAVPMSLCRMAASTRQFQVLATCPRNIEPDIEGVV
jgi:hypothetical protein